MENSPLSPAIESTSLSDTIPAPLTLAESPAGTNGHPVPENAVAASGINPTADSESPSSILPPEIQTLLEKWPKIPGNIRKIIMALAEAEDPK
jgi:hypothetical protein